MGLSRTQEDRNRGLFQLLKSIWRKSLTPYECVTSLCILLFRVGSDGGSVESSWLYLTLGQHSHFSSSSAVLCSVGIFLHIVFILWCWGIKPLINIRLTLSHYPYSFKHYFDVVCILFLYWKLVKFVNLYLALNRKFWLKHHHHHHYYFIFLVRILLHSTGWPVLIM